MNILNKHVLRSWRV